MSGVHIWWAIALGAMRISTRGQCSRPDCHRPLSGGPASVHGLCRPHPGRILPEGNIELGGYSSIAVGSGPYNWSPGRRPGCNGEVMLRCDFHRRHYGERIDAWHIYKHAVGSAQSRFVGSLPFSASTTAKLYIPQFQFTDNRLQHSWPGRILRLRLDSIRWSKDRHLPGRVSTTPTSVSPRRSVSVRTAVRPGTADGAVQRRSRGSGRPVAMAYHWSFVQPLEDPQSLLSLAVPAQLHLQRTGQLRSAGLGRGAASSAAKPARPCSAFQVGAARRAALASAGKALTSRIGSTALPAVRSMPARGVAKTATPTASGFPPRQRAGSGCRNGSYPAVAEVDGRPAIVYQGYSQIVYRRSLDAAGSAGT